MILRAEVTSIGGDVSESTSSFDRSFQKGTISGLQAWYTAENIAVANGGSVTNWKDKSITDGILKMWKATPGCLLLD